jgi:hypothetical protein
MEEREDEKGKVVVQRQRGELCALFCSITECFTAVLLQILWFTIIVIIIISISVIDLDIRHLRRAMCSCDVVDSRLVVIFFIAEVFTLDINDLFPGFFKDSATPGANTFP